MSRTERVLKRDQSSNFLSQEYYYIVNFYLLIYFCISYFLIFFFHLSSSTSLPLSYFIYSFSFHTTAFTISAFPHTTSVSLAPMSASYLQRLELEKLMSRDVLNRLPNTDTRHRNESRYSDPRVLNNPRICKSYLVGSCPYDMLRGTKENLGRCPRIHNKKYKIIYDAAIERGEKLPHHNFELDYLHDLEDFLDRCNRKAAQAERRLQSTEEEKESVANITTQIDEYDTRIAVTTQEIETFTNKGEVEKAIELSIRLKSYIFERQKLAESYNNALQSMNQSATQKLQVCKVCGSFLSVLDSDKRLAFHFTGKLHLSYVDMRATVDDIKRRLSLKD